mmetsp:Transcript_22256/g.44159  ORF Transcript_22256/g.44159 Transcript_22256/m.44159 type:complete len:330 (-) Transcript_22256:455-1444(-)
MSLEGKLEQLNIQEDWKVSMNNKLIVIHQLQTGSNEPLNQTYISRLNALLAVETQAELPNMTLEQKEQLGLQFANEKAALDQEMDYDYHRLGLASFDMDTKLATIQQLQASANEPPNQTYGLRINQIKQLETQAGQLNTTTEDKENFAKEKAALDQEMECDYHRLRFANLDLKDKLSTIHQLQSSVNESLNQEFAIRINYLQQLETQAGQPNTTTEDKENFAKEKTALDQEMQYHYHRLSFATASARLMTQHQYDPQGLAALQRLRHSLTRIDVLWSQRLEERVSGKEALFDFQLDEVIKLMSEAQEAVEVKHVKTDLVKVQAETNKSP